MSSKHVHRGRKRHRRKKPKFGPEPLKKWVTPRVLLKCFLSVAVAVGLFVYIYFYFLRPGATERMEIFKGVYFTAVELEQHQGTGQEIIIEVQWDTPGVELFIPQFNYIYLNKRRYKLNLSEPHLIKNDLEVLVQSSRYTPSGLFDSIPFRTVDNVETVVLDGRVSNIFPNCFTLWWDREGNVHAEGTKPPNPDNFRNATMGTSVQTWQVWDGKVDYNSLSNMYTPYPRMFIGVDPDTKRLWLMCFNGVLGSHMGELAQSLGVKFGGQMATHSAAALIYQGGLSLYYLALKKFLYPAA